MSKLILLIILGYVVFRIFRSMLVPKQKSEKVRGNKSDTGSRKNINNKKIEDADYEEIE